MAFQIIPCCNQWHPCQQDNPLGSGPNPQNNIINLKRNCKLYSVQGRLHLLYLRLGNCLPLSELKLPRTALTATTSPILTKTRKKVTIVASGFSSNFHQPPRGLAFSPIFADELGHQVRPTALPVPFSQYKSKLMRRRISNYIQKRII